MECKKCSGLMSYEGFYGSESDAVWYYPGWRCVHCGDVVDSIIALNRRLNDQSHNSHNNARRYNGNGNGNGHYQNGFSKRNGKPRGFIFKVASVAHHNTATDSEAYDSE